MRLWNSADFAKFDVEISFLLNTSNRNRYLRKGKVFEFLPLMKSAAVKCDLSQCWLVITPRPFHDICPPCLSVWAWRSPVQTASLAGRDLIHLDSNSLEIKRVCVRARVWLCVYSVRRRCDGRWHVSGCGRAHVICLAEHGAVNGSAPGSGTCNIVTSELVCCPIWPVERGHISDMLARAECFTSAI